MITDYGICHAYADALHEALRVLADDVHRWISRGYEPFEQMVVAKNPRVDDQPSWQVMQTMVKRKVVVENHSG